MTVSPLALHIASISRPRIRRYGIDGARGWRAIAWWGFVIFGTGAGVSDVFLFSFRFWFDLP